MNSTALLSRFRHPPGAFQLVRGRKCPTAPETERLIERLAAREPPPRVHCFLGKRNVFESEAILGLLEKRGFIPTFSPGVGGRLNEEEIFHLANFLDVLRINYERDEGRRNYYRRWREELLATGHSDSQPNDISQGNSSVFAFATWASKLFAFFKRNADSPSSPPTERQMPEAFLLERNSHAQFGPSRERLETGGWLSTRMFLLPEQEECALIERAFAAGRQPTLNPVTAPRILICGWYGTETLGDKAILGGVVDVIRRQWPEIAIDLASLEPYVSRMTVRQMPDLKVDRVLTLGEAFAMVTEAQYSAVAIGGGPLMSSIPWCTHLLEIFAAAKQAGVKCLIAGCGIGPLYVNYRNAAIKHLLELADEVVLRDRASAQIARDELKVEQNCEVALDPAFIWIRRRTRPSERDASQILLALRNWPIEEFAARMDRTRAEQIKAAYEMQLVVMIKEILRRDPSIKLIPFCMHKYAVGGDDRIFYRRLLVQFPEILSRLDNRHRTPMEDLGLIARSRAVLAMRFHSVVFALGTNTPFLAVDYTLGGKVAGVLEDVQARDLLIPIDRFDGKSTAERLLALKGPAIDVSRQIRATEDAITKCFACVPLGRSQELQGNLAFRKRGIQPDPAALTSTMKKPSA